RISADAGTPDGHRQMHNYPIDRNDFEIVLANVQRLSEFVDDLGISFILDPKNVNEIELAARVFLERGADFIEFKPKYLPGYGIDAAWLAKESQNIRNQLIRARSTWKDRIIVNNQIEQLINGGRVISLQVPPRRCR